MSKEDWIPDDKKKLRNYELYWKLLYKLEIDIDEAMEESKGDLYWDDVFCVLERLKVCFLDSRFKKRNGKEHD